MYVAGVDGHSLTACHANTRVMACLLNDRGLACGDLPLGRVPDTAVRSKQSRLGPSRQLCRDNEQNKGIIYAYVRMRSIYAPSWCNSMSPAINYNSKQGPSKYYCICQPAFHALACNLKTGIERTADLLCTAHDYAGELS